MINIVAKYGGGDMNSPRILTGGFWGDVLRMFAWLIVYYIPILVGFLILKYVWAGDIATWPGDARVVCVILLVTTIGLWHWRVAEPGASKHLPLRQTEQT